MCVYVCVCVSVSVCVCVYIYMYVYMYFSTVKKDDPSKDFYTVMGPHSRGLNPASYTMMTAVL